MKVVGILGLLLLVFGVLVMLIGIGGAVANFVFPPESLNCKMADADYEKAQKLMKEYEAAKGTPDELKKKIEVELAIAEAQSSQDYCGRAKESHRFYGLVFSGVGVVGFFMTVIGGIAAVVGLRRKKTLA